MGQILWQAKMRAEGLSGAAIASFKNSYFALVSLPLMT
jgi:hypothetical protein